MCYIFRGCENPCADVYQLLPRHSRVEVLVSSLLWIMLANEVPSDGGRAVALQSSPEMFSVLLGLSVSTGFCEAVLFLSSRKQISHWCKASMSPPQPGSFGLDLDIGLNPLKTRSRLGVAIPHGSSQISYCCICIKFKTLQFAYKALI